MAKQQRTVPSVETLEGYEQLLKDVKSILDRGLSRAYQAVDNMRVQTYWQIGERVTREELVHQNRADYGKRMVEQLARDLGYSRRLMYEIVRFYKTYPIVHALRAQLSWTHYHQLTAIEDKEERDFYEIQTGWFIFHESLVDAFQNGQKSEGKEEWKEGRAARHRHH